MLSAAALCLLAAGVTRSRIALKQQQRGGLKHFCSHLCQLEESPFILAWLFGFSVLVSLGDDIEACAGADIDPLQPLLELSTLICWSEII